MEVNDCCGIGRSDLYFHYLYNLKQYCLCFFKYHQQIWCAELQLILSESFSLKKYEQEWITNLPSINIIVHNQDIILMYSRSAF